MEMEEVGGMVLLSKTTSEWVDNTQTLPYLPIQHQQSLYEIQILFMLKMFHAQQLSNGNVFLQWSVRDFTEINSNGTDV
jgi:hypothetical protein